MPGFADSFWSADYATGVDVLFEKLQQGVIENDQVLAIARMRADAEEQYSRRLYEIIPATERMSNGFQKDDGASLKKAYDGVRTEMSEASKTHSKISKSITELVVEPFARWSEGHEARVINSHEDLLARIRALEKQNELVRKLRSAYFNKCRQLEDMEEESKLGFQEPEKAESSPKGKAPAIKLPEEQPEEQEPVELGDELFSPDRLKELLANMLTNIPLGEIKVPILGTYHNVSTGSDIVEYIQKNMGASSVSLAERIGQDLVSSGMLRLVGNVGSTFANSSKMSYQWRSKVFFLTGMPEKRQAQRVGSVGSEATADSPISSMGDVLQGWNPLNNPYPNATPVERMRREAQDADEKYKASVRKLDSLRCNLEESMVERFKYMEQCELDRLKALKAVLLDFSGTMGNVIPSLQSAVDNMMLYQEAIQPQGDLRYLLENYKTGSFIPRVQIYDNYYNNVEGMTFGVDLEARARQDRKRVPTVVTTILMFLDNHYPDLEGDEVRRNIWTVDVPLAAAHHLRSQINNGEPPPREILERYEVPIVASALKLYLLELPDSLVSSQVYEVIKTVYSSPQSSASDEARVSVLQNTLGQLRLANIATLDAITTHFTRLIELTSADEAYVANLAQVLAPCILRPRVENTITMHERCAYRLIRDLFDHKEEIFGELKRASSQNSGSSKAPQQPPPQQQQQQQQQPQPQRQSGGTSDESNRRANMEARTKAIMSRSRATSPAPLQPGMANARHRRDRSMGDPHMRFPVVASPSAADNVHRRGRASLEVPDGGAPEPQQAKPEPPAAAPAPAPAPVSMPAPAPAPTIQEPPSTPPGSSAAPATQISPPSIQRSPPPTTSANGGWEMSATMTFDDSMMMPEFLPQDDDVPAPVAEEESPQSSTGGLEKKPTMARSALASRVQRKVAASGGGSSFQIGKVSRAGTGLSSQGSLRDGKRDSNNSLREDGEGNAN